MNLSVHNGPVDPDIMIAKREIEYFDPTCKDCGDILTTEELVCWNCREEAERARCLKAVDGEPEHPGKIDSGIRALIKQWAVLENPDGVEMIFKAVTKIAKKNIKERINHEPTS